MEIVVEAYSYPINYKGEYHYRSGSTKQELKGAALNKFLLQKQGKRWDGVPIPNLSLKELSQTSLQYFRKQASLTKRLSPEDLQDNDTTLIEKLNLLEGDYLKRACALLFYSNPEKYVGGSYVKIGYFANDADLLYQDEIHGSLFEQVEKTMDLLLTKYMRANIEYQGLSRIEKYEFPEYALRETLLNAIAHKDYSGATPIQISVYKDKIIFWNEGQLPDNWTIERLKSKHPSKPYNPDIANVFFRAGLIESWGRGISKIISECKANAFPEPTFNYEYSGMTVEFSIVPIPFLNGNNTVLENSTSLKTGLKTSLKTSLKIKGEIEKKIIEIIKQYPRASIKEIADNIGNISRNGAKYHLEILKSEKQIIHVGAKKGGYWKILSDEENLD